MSPFRDAPVVALNKTTTGAFPKRDGIQEEQEHVFTMPFKCLNNLKRRY